MKLDLHLLNKRIKNREKISRLKEQINRLMNFNFLDKKIVRLQIRLYTSERREFHYSIYFAKVCSPYLHMYK
jgi:hypothetical protein